MRGLVSSVLVVTLAACGSVVGTPDGTVSISPRQPKTMDELVASSTSNDDRLSFQWSKNGAVRADLAGASVDPGLTTKNEVWRVDLIADGESISSDEVTILNSPPPTPVVSFTPGEPFFANAPITCSVMPGETDPDGDPVTLLANWTKNGTAFNGATMTAFAGDTVPAAQVMINDTFVCTVSASDGADASVAAMATATASCLGALGDSQTFAAIGVAPMGTLQSFTVPDGVCRITIEAGGGEGGENNGVAGSTNGARMIGTFILPAASVLKVLVGQAAAPIGGQRLCGGGGTFVLDAADAPLVIAGGGGSHFSSSPTVAETVGRIETSGGTLGTMPRADNGQGGTTETGSTSGGGGGLLTSGAGVGAGQGFLQGGFGGGTETSKGGYGGGGGRAGSFGQGAGGGYSGGSCGDTSGSWVGCGGGGSFNGGTAQINTAGAVVGNGYVRLSW